ncbi:hypothetical protein BDQ17DRAFT_1334331 [Cyathus striatus]|nr:hypothetical protein BDQ17DRAFT_1334331 [Cyathus striatus]
MSARIGFPFANTVTMIGFEVLGLTLLRGEVSFDGFYVAELSSHQGPLQLQRMGCLGVTRQISHIVHHHELQGIIQLGLFQLVLRPLYRSSYETKCRESFTMLIIPTRRFASRAFVARVSISSMCIALVVWSDYRSDYALQNFLRMNCHLKTGYYTLRMEFGPDLCNHDLRVDGLQLLLPAELRTLLISPIIFELADAW